ncbi:hypothetical protein CDL15_Pgr010613 [Punica granatum]|uniref:Uncharacterized protein n=1 Tax=Punica granatum TaxID=22663 RepID=A0A218VS87_PUNGR|nr:hypothetical protein CDL15_Pgr010613 [Punica granatum]
MEFPCMVSNLILDSAVEGFDLDVCFRSRRNNMQRVFCDFETKVQETRPIREGRVELGADHIREDRVESGANYIREDKVNIGVNQARESRFEARADEREENIAFAVSEQPSSDEVEAYASVEQQPSDEAKASAYAGLEQQPYVVIKEMKNM